MDRTYKLLLLDEDEADRAVVRSLLATGPLFHELSDTSSVANARRELARALYDCFLVDFRLPENDGFALLHELREAQPSLPIVVLTDQSDRETAVAVMKAGASDFLAKATATPQLVAQAIRGAVRTHRAERAALTAREAQGLSELRYRFLAESIPQMVWIAGADLALEYVNRRTSDITGMSLDDLQQKGLEVVFHPDDVPRSRALWERARKSGVPYEHQHRMRVASTGEYRWVLSRAEPFRDAAGTIQQWFGTSTDIDAQKRLEERQTARMHESEAARRHAEELNRAKDDFLAVLSHELRTPLHSISGWLQILRQSELPDARAREAIDSIDRNTRSQTRLIEDLLDVSRIVSGKLSIQHNPVELGAVLRSAAEVVAPSAKARSVELVVELPTEPLGVVRGDASRLQQVAWNLLSNAIKFSHPGGDVRLEALREGAWLVLRVRDHGAGIDPAFLPLIFERFRQEDSSTTRRQGGLGLGLAIVKHLVELHDGEIKAHSEGEGTGAVFTVRLPVAELGAREAPVTPEPQRLTAPKRGGASLNGLRVLLVDDDDDSREMMMHALVMQGANVLEAASADECRALHARTLPQAIVSDIGMPGEDGYSLMRSVRAVDADVYAVALTGYAADDDRERARRAGFDAHLTKPVDLAALVKLLLERRRP
jgi:PAS domain S-box-containing protein